MTLSCAASVALENCKEDASPATWEQRYVYDGNGKRVRRDRRYATGAIASTVYAYGAGGELAAEYGEPEQGGTQYVTVDHLGSTRVTTNGTGAVVARLDYEPFGQELMVTGASPRNGVAGYGSLSGLGLTRRFSSKERDPETGLDYFGARYFAGAMGRFTSADAPFADQAADDPQSWNLYAYVRNNPLQYVDEDGRSIYTKAAKVAGKLLKGGDKLAAFADNVQDFNNLTGAGNSITQRVAGGLMLATELLPISGHDIEAGINAAANLYEQARDVRDAFCPRMAVRRSQVPALSKRWP